MGLIGYVDDIVSRLAATKAIDGPNAAISRLSDRLDAVPAPPAYVHPKLVWIPVAAWGAAKLLDLARQPKAARAFVGLGVASAIPTMISGHEDWTRAAPPLQRVASVHAALNNLAVYAYTASWFARGADRQRAGVALSWTGGVLLTAAVVLGLRMNRHLDQPDS